METSNYDYAMTRPNSAGEMPLPKRQGARSVIPLSWLSRTATVDYINANGHASTAKGVLQDFCPVGLLMVVGGTRTLISFDRVVSVELVGD